MSASPQWLHLTGQSTTSEIPLAAEKYVTESELQVHIEAAVQASNKARLRAIFGVIGTCALGVLAGYFLYLLWEQVNVHDGQIARQQTIIEHLTANETTVSNQVSRLRAIDGSVDSLRTQFESQAQRLSHVEQNQNGVRDQITAMNARWQREFKQLSAAKLDTTPIPSVAAGQIDAEKVAPVTSSAPATPAQPAPAAEKHNETFSPDLKPTPNAYAQMSPSGLVIWMTPRPGFAKPVPASVIGHVRGLGILVHDWDDNNHYFITESGSWILDQR
ncbi:MAG: hypothetical protein ACJ74Y_15205 [Bryobacteraceae bacterium]